MKKVKVTLAALVIMFVSLGAYPQPIHDNAVIPMGITLNTILRLNILRGGNIEFVFTDINDFLSGLSGPQYQTEFEVSASQNWEIEMGAENATFIGDNPNAGASFTPTLALGNVGYYLEYLGATWTWGTEISGTATSIQANIDELTVWTAPAEIVTAMTSNGGDASTNHYSIYWRCGSSEGNMTQPYFYQQTYSEGRYATNILMLLKRED